MILVYRSTNQSDILTSMSFLRISRKRLFAVLIVLIVVAGLVGAGYWYWNWQLQNQRAAEEELRDPVTGLTPKEEQANERILDSIDSISGTVESIDTQAQQIVIRSGDTTLALSYDDATRTGKGIAYDEVQIANLAPGQEISAGFWKQDNKAYELWVP